MKDLFRGYYRPTEDEFRILWDKGVFILDTSVILRLYRYSKETRDDMLKILRGLSERLWIPYQVALEYQENYPGVIEEQKNEYYRVKEILKGAGIRNEQILNRLLEELNCLERKQPDYDAIRDEIEQILDGKVGPPPDSQQWLDEVCKDGEDRYERRLPPGYADSKEKGEKVCVYSSFSFKKKYGDLILWEQIIKQAAEREDFKYIVFITDDGTEDWWRIVNKSKTIGPHPELVREIMIRADVSIFHMYNSENFMKYAKKYLNIQIKQESIEQVRDMSKALELYLRIINMSDHAVSTPWGDIGAGGTLDVRFPSEFQRFGTYTIIIRPPEPTEEEIEEARKILLEMRRKTLAKKEFEKKIE